MSNKIKIIIGVLVLILLAIVITYGVNPSVADRFLSEDYLKERKAMRIQNIFPEHIAEYALYGDKKDRISTKVVCNKIEDNPTLKETGRTGDACMETYVAEYRGPSMSTTSLVHVNISKFTKASDMFHLLITKTTDSDTLDSKPIFRLKSTGLAWFPESKFDFIVIQEGVALVSTSTVTYKYLDHMVGTDAVTKYFISKYSPK
jgi:hypothetical protein